jgi:methylated-DNA-protein-cysteine methyltransferase-like protein
MKSKKTKPVLNTFAAAVIRWILKIPKGRVATYGQIAALAGKPHGARGVAWILHSSSTKYGLPWHRVLNAKGKISFHPTASHYSLQKKRLQAEGVDFSSQDQIRMSHYQWKKTPKRPAAVVSKKKNQPTLFS